MKSYWPLILILAGMLLFFVKATHAQNAVQLPSAKEYNVTTSTGPVCTDAPTLNSTTPYIICGAKTKAGTPCKHKVAKSGDKCKQHNPAEPRCKATTKEGKECQRLVPHSGDRCSVHSDKGTKQT